jgi:arylsulfatase A-like enzyme
MCDQLRADYLSCAGHPTLRTPTIDGLAARGVSFRRAYVQSPVCGPSRMSFYTGRYMASHGATWNNVPLQVGEVTLGDYLRPAGLRVALAGKTHMAADAEGMARLGISPDSARGLLAAECGFEPFDRHDGLHPKGYGKGGDGYARHLRARGYRGDNLWEECANSADGPNGERLSGWQMRHARLPARVRDEDSETAYITDRALAFIAEQGERPWCLHLSYIKPHWPYIAAAPYNDMYGADQILPAKCDPREKIDPHPVYAAYLRHDESVSFARDEVRRTVIPTYMGLVRQIDDHLARLVSSLETAGRLDDTLIAFTSDHGDYLGDHYLGEKELFHEQSARIPLIIYDPDPTADATRGATDDRLVEAIDILPTFVEAVGVAPPMHILEGHSLLPLLRGQRAAYWRDAVFSELDYSFRPARLILGRGPAACRAVMIRTERWKYICYDGFRPQLFDLKSEPDEFVDRGADPALAAVRAELHEQVFAWLRARKLRRTVSDEAVAARTAGAGKRGVHVGIW